MVIYIRGKGKDAIETEFCEMIVNILSKCAIGLISQTGEVDVEQNLKAGPGADYYEVRLFKKD